jgi:hypothetical protein
MDAMSCKNNVWRDVVLPGNRLLFLRDNRPYDMQYNAEISQTGRLGWPSFASRKKKNRQTNQRKEMDELKELETNIPQGVWDGKRTAE